MFNIWNPLETYQRKKIQCTARFYNLDYRLSDFDRYDEYFRSDSVLTLAQTGSYVGVSNILEYVGFADSRTSPYLSQGPIIQSYSFKVLGLNGNGQCEFLFASKSRFITDQSITGEEFQFDTTSMMKIYLDYDKQYITENRIFYPTGFVEFFMSTILSTSENAIRFVCDTVLAENCAGFLDPTVSENCIERLTALPVAEHNDTLLHIDGNSKGCRLMHSVLALANPELHCPHVALDPMPDPNGKIKCHKSKQIRIDTLFEQNQLDFFHDFQLENGINPDVGYMVIN